MSSKSHILETAISLVSEHGLRATSTALIAKEAGIANGTLFHHYATKEVLMQEAYLYVQQEKLRYLKKFMPDDSMSEEDAYALIAAMIEYWMDHPDQFSFMRECFHSSVYTDTLRLKIEQLHLKTKNILTTGIERGCIANMDIDLITSCMQGTIIALVALIMRCEDNEKKQLYKQQGIQFILSAVKAK